MGYTRGQVDTPMYTAFYGLREKPFALSPNPRYLYLADSHREALAHLLYGLEQGEGFIVISGEVGTGKTTICRSLLERLGSESEVAFLFNPSRNASELLQSINEEFGLPAGGLSRREILSRLNHFLLEKKREARRVVLIIDEAQNLSAGTLEQVRLLSNLETESSKLIQIILLGQPELDDKLDSDELRQLRQRIGVRWRLEPLPRADTFAYVNHRLRVAAGAERQIFSEGALREIHRRARGVPRLINVVCDRALLAGYAAGAHRVGPGLVRRTAVELPDTGERGKGRATRLPRSIFRSAVAAAALLAVFWLGWTVGTRPEHRWLSRAARVLAQGGATPDVASRPVASVPESAEHPTVSAVATATAPRAPEAPPLQGEEIWLGLPVAARLQPDPPAGHRVRLVTGDGEFLARLLAGLDYETVAADAVAAVAESYGRPAPPDPPRSVAEALAGLAAAGLAVASLEQTSFEQLRLLDYPALLELQDPAGEPRLVALVRLQGEIAELVGVSTRGSLRAPLNAVEKLWNGSAHVVWRSFEPLPEILGFGESGSGVLWLQQALAQLGYFESPASGVYDEHTRQGVRLFQESRHLTPDGVTGPLTQMILYDELGSYSRPSLSDGETG